MIQHISALTNEVRELKQSVKAQTIAEDVRELKQKFDDLLNNLELTKAKLPNSQHTAVINNSVRDVVTVVAEGKQTKPSRALAAATNAFDSHRLLTAASSVSSLPTVDTGELNGANMFDDNTQRTHHASDWVRVQRRRRNRQPALIGTNTSTELEVVVQKKWVHLSSFKSTVSSEQIKDYVEKNTEFGKHHLECYKLVKKDVDISSLKKVNFKLGVSPCFYEEILNSKLWPTDIRVRPFVNFPRHTRPAEQR